MSATWKFPKILPFEVQGRDLSEDNFAQEERTNLDILIREMLQNPLDARAADNVGPVKVRVRTLVPGSYDEAYLANLLGSEYSARLKASGGEPPADIQKCPVLVIEDFGTTGLQGTFDDQDVDGSGENWNAFWFREGEGAKATTGSNGRAGQGKITYYRVGETRAVFGVTVRKSDKKRLLMGRSAFRKAYLYEGSKFRRHSFWCAGDQLPMPVTEATAIEAFATAFKLNRVDEPGLSLVIPCPVGFDLSEAIRTTVAEFYYPIAIGRLVVELGDVIVDSATIDGLADAHAAADDKSKKRCGFSKSYRDLVRGAIEDQKSAKTPVVLTTGWEKNAKLSSDAFQPGVLDQLRASLEAGERVAIRCPIDVRPKSGPPTESWFDVHLRIPEDLAQSEEAYIRRDLLIGAEAYLTASGNLQKAQALTLIMEPALSAFLADAEEPTHLKWNGSRPRLAEDYTNAKVTLSAVRNAAPRLLTLFSNGLVKRDTKALAKFFNRPAASGPSGSAGGQTAGKRPSGAPPIEPPPAPVRKPFRIVTGIDSIRIVSNGSAKPLPADLPMSCVLVVAYEGLDQDPFKWYDPFDFDLGDAKSHPVNVSGANITGRAANKIHFEVTDPDFSLEVAGFDKNIRLKARLSFAEKTNG